MSHLEQRQQRDLNRIREQMVEQANWVARAVENALHAVETGDRNLAWTTVLEDHRINRQMRAIDTLCHSFIAVHLPSAGPLRLLSSIIRANTELERIGDYAVTIAREAVQLSQPPSGALASALERISGECLLMLRQSVRAFRELNADLARGTIGIAGQLEHNLDLVYEELINGTETPQVRDHLAIFVIFNQLKRVADQSKNLCEHAVFAQTGEPKRPKQFRILFLDRRNDRLGPLATAIAASSFPNTGAFSSAGLDPAPALERRLLDFLGERGLPAAARGPRALGDVTHHELRDQKVLVCLEGSIDDYLTRVPFHTSVQHWALGATEDMEALYRELAPAIRDLMELLRGEGAN